MATKVLLLGSTGFAGRHFRADALAAGHEVVGAARHPAEGDLTCDLLDPVSVQRAVRETEPGLVINLAGAASVSESWRRQAATFQVNALGTLHLLEAVARHAPDAHLLCASSGEVYGAVPEAEQPISEDCPPRPLNPYAASKLAMEVLCGQHERSSGLSITVVRAFNHLGPGQSDRFAASSFARQIAEAERDGASAVTLRVGDLSPARDFTDVRDTVRAYRLLLEGNMSGTYNVCSGEPTVLRELIDLLAASTPLAIRVAVDDGRLRPQEVPVAYGSHQRVTAATGWTASTPLAHTLVDLLDSWRERLAA